MHLTNSVSLGRVFLSIPKLSASTLGLNICHVDNVLPLDGLQIIQYMFIIEVSNSPKIGHKECCFNTLTLQTRMSR